MYDKGDGLGERGEGDYLRINMKSTRTFRRGSGKGSNTVNDNKLLESLDTKEKEREDVPSLAQSEQGTTLGHGPCTIHEPFTNNLLTSFDNVSPQ